jgi:hypothetical protein
VIAAAAFGGGLIVGSAGAGDDQQAAPAPVTSLVERKVFTDNCTELQSATERQACEGVESSHQLELERVKREAREQGKKDAEAATAKPQKEPKPAPAPAAALTDGLYKVGADIPAGSYRTAGGGGSPCYYARLKTDDTSSYIANNISSGPMRMTVRSSDGYVEFSGGCKWTKVG